MKQLKTTSPNKKFSVFLAIPDNHRIIFSGIFGNGKTTFLKSYFKQNENYLAIHLFPTNYTASKNEDIFELIKFDILYEILRYKPDFKNFKFEKIYAAYLAIFDTSNNALEPLAALIESVPKIGKPLASVYKIFLEFNEVIKKKIEQTKDSDYEKIKTFTKKIDEKVGSPYESDLYTFLIKNLLKSVKKKNKKPKAILVIDDLDRIDPDQIFRLLNVFSVHFDVEGTENKFGFDKILFCCDASNIRRIFHNRFGLDVDFNGYFDKFYSKEIFYFDNRAEIKKSVIEILSTVNPKRKKLWDKQKDLTPDTTTFALIQYLIENMIVSEVFSLRQLVRLNELPYDEKKYQIRNAFKSEFTNHNIHIAVGFDFMISIFGNGEALINAIRRTQFSKTELHFSYSYDRFCADLIMLADFQQNRFQAGVEFVHEKTNTKYTISPNALSSFQKVFFANVIKGDKSDWMGLIDLRELILDAFLIYSSLKGDPIHED